MQASIHTTHTNNAWDLIDAVEIQATVSNYAVVVGIHKIKLLKYLIAKSKTSFHFHLQVFQAIIIMIVSHISF